MSLSIKVRSFLRNVFSPRRVETDLDQEVRSHLEMLTEENIRAGMPGQEAQRAARIELGGIEHVKEQVREVRIGNWIHSVISDCQYAVRQLRMNPGFSVVVVLTLALGFGATTAVFSVINATLLQGLPYHDASQLVEISAKNPQGEDVSISNADFADLQNASHSFAEFGYAGDWKFYALTGGGEPDEAWGWQLSTNLFQVLGVHSVLGRTFASGDMQSVILSNRYWRTHFQGNPDVIGRTVSLDGNPFTIIGVMPPDFYFRTPATDLWVPLVVPPQDWSRSDKRSLSVIGRLKTGVTLQQARTEIQSVQTPLAALFPKDDLGWAMTARVMRDSGLEDFQTIVLVLFGAVFFTLLIACVNVANMFFARGTTRQREIALRAVLGAARSRLIRQLLTESLLVSGFSGFIGLALAMVAVRSVIRLVPSSSANAISSLQEITLNLPVMCFGLALALFTGLAVGLLPALQGSEIGLLKSLKEGAATTSATAKKLRLQGLFVIVEVGLTLILLVGAGLMMESFHQLARVNLGFDPNHVLTVRVPLVTNKYAQGPRSSVFYREALEKVRAIPGVQSAALVNNLPLSGFESMGYFTVPGKARGEAPQQVNIGLQAVSPGYFHAMGIALLRGRDFSSDDEREGAAKVAILSESMAKRYWPGEDLIGKPLDPDVTIIGVVTDTKRHTLGEQADPQAFIPYGQHPFASFLVTFVVRTAPEPLALAPAVRNAVRSLDQDQPVIQVRTMDDVVAESIWQTTFSMTVLTVLGGVALFLSAVGIYGVISYIVGQRTHEIGVRVALGAQRRHILRLVVGRGLAWVLIGTVIGIGGSLVVTRFLTSVLYSVKPTDPAVFLGVAILLASIAMAACYIPARRVTRVDPMIALRYE